MKFSQRIKAIALIPALGLLAAPVFAGNKPCDAIASVSTAAAAPGKNIVDTAVEAGSFKTLAAALSAAGLVEALKAEGPFTVFAPTDDAFAALPAGTVETLLKPENKAKLQAVLKYHVVPGRVYAADAIKAAKAKTLQGSSVTIASKEGKVMIDGATVIKPDLETTNGVIHVIDKVILPKD